MTTSLTSYSSTQLTDLTHDDTKMIDLEDKKKMSPLKLHYQQQQASPDSTNNNNSMLSNNNTVVNSNMMTATTATNTFATLHPNNRGRGRKTAPAYVQVIPGQPVAVARRNARERNRVKQVNNGFSNLRQHIPFTARNKKMSKVETLRCAVEYIRSLQHLLIENGGYDGMMDHDLSLNISSSSPLSSLDSTEDMTSSDLYESEHHLGTPGECLPTSSQHHTDQLLVTNPSADDAVMNGFHPAEFQSAQLRHGSVILQTLPSRLYHPSIHPADEVTTVILSEPSPHHVLRHGSSSLSPGYSDRSSVNNSPASANTQEITSTGFMGVFTAAAAGLDKHLAAPITASSIVDRTAPFLFKKERQDELNAAQNALIFKKERQDDEDNLYAAHEGRLIQLEAATNTVEMVDALAWWELEQTRRIQIQHAPS